MATDYKIVEVPDHVSSAPSVWDYNYYVSRLYSVYSYTIDNTVQALVLYHLWLYIYRHHYSKREVICVRTMVVRSNLVHLADTATQAIQCVYRIHLH